MANNINVSLVLKSAQFQKGIDKVASSLNGLGRTATAVSRQMQFLGALAVTKGLYDATEGVLEFDTAMAKLEATLGSASGIDMLEKSARELGKSTEFTADQIAMMQLELAKAGVASNDIVGLDAEIIKIARAFDVDLEEAVSSLIQTYNQFKSEFTDKTIAESAEEISTSVLAVSDATLSSTTSLQSGLNQVGPVANQFGVNLNTVITLLGLLADKGIDASKAGTGLRRLILDIGSAGKDVNASLRDLIDGLVDVEDLTTEVYGKTTASALIGMREEFDRITSAVENSGGILDRYAGILGGTITNALRTLQSSLSEVGLKMRDAFGEDIKDAIGAVRNFINGITEADVRMAGAIAKVVLFAGAMAKLAQVGIRVFGAITKVVDVVLKLGRFVGLAAGPIAAIASALLVAVTAFFKYKSAVEDAALATKKFQDLQAKGKALVDPSSPINLEDLDVGQLEELKKGYLDLLETFNTDKFANIYKKVTARLEQAIAEGVASPLEQLEQDEKRKGNLFDTDSFINSLGGLKEGKIDRDILRDAVNNAKKIFEYTKLIEEANEAKAKKSEAERKEAEKTAQAAKDQLDTQISRQEVLLKLAEQRQRAHEELAKLVNDTTSEEELKGIVADLNVEYEELRDKTSALLDNGIELTNEEKERLGVLERTIALSNDLLGIKRAEAALATQAAREEARRNQEFLRTTPSPSANNDTNIARFEATQEKLAEMRDTIAEMNDFQQQFFSAEMPIEQYENLLGLFQGIQLAAQSIVMQMSQLADTLIEKVFEKTLSVKEAFGEFFKSLLKQIAMLLIKIAVLTTAIVIGNALTGGAITKVLTGQNMGMGAAGIASFLALEALPSMVGGGKSLAAGGGGGTKSISIDGQISGNNLVLGTRAGTIVNRRTYG